MNNLRGISNKIDEALDQLYEKDAYLICFNDKFHVSERSITHKLGGYLARLFESYDVDCEYNRFGYEGKFVEKLKQNVIPDIIIHKYYSPQYIEFETTILYKYTHFISKTCNR